MQRARAVKKIRSFNRFYTNLIGVIDRHILDSPYSLTEVRLLFEIYHYPNSTARNICHFLRVDEGYLSRTIEKLIQKRLIVRRRSESDKREYLLALSQKGKKEFLGLNRTSETEVKTMIEHLSSKEADQLVSAIETIERLLNEESSGDVKY